MPKEELTVVLPCGPVAEPEAFARETRVRSRLSQQIHFNLPVASPVLFAGSLDGLDAIGFVGKDTFIILLSPVSNSQATSRKIPSSRRPMVSHAKTHPERRGKAMALCLKARKWLFPPVTQWRTPKPSHGRPVFDPSSHSR
jgi:hypothetical protein